MSTFSLKPNKTNSDIPAFLSYIELVSAVNRPAGNRIGNFVDK